MEDLDRGRVRDEFYQGIIDDLTWLRLKWDEPIERQSKRLALYRSALETLITRGLTYFCTCSRRDIVDAASAPQEGSPMLGPDGLVYPGTCRTLGASEGTSAAIRLDLERAINFLGGPEGLRRLDIVETGLNAGTSAPETDDLLSGTGDVVLRRRDGAPAYHLAVVVDDAAQGITRVTRGEDLAAAAPIQRILQALLGLPSTIYHHHRLIRDETGRRLAKRHDSLALAQLRRDGASPIDVRDLIGLH